MIQRKIRIWLIAASTVGSCVEEPERQTLLVVSEITPLAIDRAITTVEIVDIQQSHRYKEGGVCWATVPLPDIAGAHDGRSILNRQKFDVTVINLEKDKLYYLRPYLLGEDGTVTYGVVKQYLNNVLPVMEDTRLVEISAEYFAIQTSISNLANVDPVTDYGHVWGLAPEPTVGVDETSHFGATSIDRQFVTQVPNFELARVYHVRAFAETGGSILYGKEIVVTTPASIVPGVWQELAMPQPYYLPYCGFHQEGQFTFFSGTVETAGFTDWTGEALQGTAEESVLYNLAYVPGKRARRDLRGFALDNAYYLGFGELVQYEFEIPEPGDPYQHDLLRYDMSTRRWTNLESLPGTGRVLAFHHDNMSGWALLLTGTNLFIYKYSIPNNTWTLMSTNSGVELGLADQYPRTISILTNNTIYFSVKGAPRLYYINLSSMALASKTTLPIDHLFPYNNSCYLISVRRVFRFNDASKQLETRNEYPADPLDGSYALSIVPPTVNTLNLETTADYTVVAAFHGFPVVSLNGVAEKSSVAFKYSEP